MKNWGCLNLMGKTLFGAALLNGCLAIFYAYHGHMFAVFSISMAMVCGLSTFNRRYEKK